MKRFLLLTVVVAAIFAILHFGLADALTLDALKARQAEFEALRAADPWRMLALFFLIYVAVTALSIPGAAILTLAAGALFGLLAGTILVSFASSIGATLAFLTARFIARGPVQARFGQRLQAIDDGIAKDGAFYLFTLRLVPVFPFFLVNLLMGLTGIRTRTFYWVSQVGMLAGTIVYVNAGTELGRIDALSDIVSPTLLLSFALLGIFPWIARWIVARVRAARVYAAYCKPRRFDRNLIVIGAGAAGLVTAYIAAAVKAKVTLIEAREMGGDCLNTGCVPSKALIRSAGLAAEMRQAHRFGIMPGGEPTVDFPALMARIRAAIATIAPHDSVERYTGLGVDVIEGRATIVDPWTVSIAQNDGTSRTLTTRAIVIAAGAAPAIPDIPGLDAVPYLTSETLWDAMSRRDRPPERLLVLGGGPIGCELSQAFARLGSQVTQVEMADSILAREDADVSALIAEALRSDGVTLLTGHRAKAIDHGRLTTDSASGETIIPFDDILIATGRAARLTGYGLEALGIETGKAVITNAWLETLYPNIYAAGDVAGPYQFTHAASHQAWYAAVNALFGRFRRFKVDYRVLPAATFTDPEVARVGINEREAREQGIAHEITRYPLSRLDRAVTDGATTGFVKILTPPGKDRILGATIVGAHAGDMLAEITLAMRHNLGLGKILGTIHSYPTRSEANKMAAGEWRRAHAPQWAMRWLERYHGWMRG